MHSNLIFILLVFVPALSQAQNSANTFKVLDNGREISVPDSILSKIVQTDEAANYVLVQWLAAEGFLNAAVESIEDDKVIINRNCSFRLDEIRVINTGELDSAKVIHPNVRYSEQELNFQIQAVAADLANQGFPFAITEISSIEPDHKNCSVNINLTVDTGIQANAKMLYFAGNRTVSQRYLRKISRFDPGRTATPRYIQSLQRNLINSELFNEVGNGQLFMREGAPIIVFQIEERDLNQFDGLLGYVPDAGGKGQIVGNLSLSLWNVLKEGNGFSLQYQRLKPETSELNINLSQDWFGNFPVGLHTGFSFYQNDSTYQSRSFEAGGYYRVSRGVKLISTIELQSTISGNIPGPIYEPDGRRQIARLGFEYTNLDRFEAPTSGLHVSMIYGIANKDLSDDTEGVILQNFLEFETQTYLPLSARNILAITGFGYYLKSDRVTFHDLVRFGGANSLRGFSEDQFRADKVFWGDVEYRFLTDRNSYLFTFAAIGVYQQPNVINDISAETDISDLLYSTGFGLSYKTRIGRLTFTYAISPEDSFANGKIHFGISTQL